MGKIVAKADFCYQRGTFDSAKGRKKKTIKTLPCIKLPGCPQKPDINVLYQRKGG